MLRQSRIRGPTFGVAVSSRRKVQSIRADGREVPSSGSRKIIETSPLDPAANLAGALRRFPDGCGLRVVSGPEIPECLQKFAWVLRRTFPQFAPLCISDHPPPALPESGNLR